MKIKKTKENNCKKKAFSFPMFINNIISIVKIHVYITKSDVQVHWNPFQIPMRGFGMYLQQALNLISRTTQTYCVVTQYSNTQED